jgi:hypothetical protein
VKHESGGILHFTEEVFNLPSPGTRDAHHFSDFGDCFDLYAELWAWEKFKPRIPRLFLAQKNQTRLTTTN